MKFPARSARVAFVVHIESPRAAAADVARIEHVVHLFHGHGLPATWSASTCGSCELMLHRGLLQPNDELAVALGSSCAASSSSFRDTLRQGLATIQACAGTPISLVAGEPAELRHHAAILAEQGIRGILSNQVKSAAATSHSPLPCGLWQLDYAVAIPHKSWLARLLAGGNSWQRLAKLIAKEQTIVVSVDALQVAQASARSLQNLEKLLRQVSLIASRDELQVITAGEIIAELTASRTSRPQRSILRAA